MGKKNENQKSSSRESKGSTVLWIIAAVVVVVSILAMSGNLPFVNSGKDTGKSFRLTEKETRPVLDPSMFSGQTRLAYAAAQRYPEIFNEVYCYCFCDETPFNHKTLLSCFTENHGAG